MPMPARVVRPRAPKPGGGSPFGMRRTARCKRSTRNAFYWRPCRKARNRCQVALRPRCIERVQRKSCNARTPVPGDVLRLHVIAASSACVGQHASTSSACSMSSRGSVVLSAANDPVLRSTRGLQWNGFWRGAYTSAFFICCSLSARRSPRLETHAACTSEGVRHSGPAANLCRRGTIAVAVSGNASKRSRALRGPALSHVPGDAMPA